MTKVVLHDLANLQNENTAVTNINQNNAIIEEAFDNTLSRDGATPNQMEATLDMNSNQIINLPQADTPHGPVRKEDIDSLTLTGIAVSTPGMLATDGSAIYSKTITGTTGEITVTDGNGANPGNPTISLPDTLTFTDKTVNFGTFNTPTIVNPQGLTVSDIAGLGATNVTNRSDLADVDPSKSTVVNLLETYRYGTWTWMNGDYSDEVTEDVLEGLYIASSFTPTTSGAWVRNVFNNNYLVDWWRTSGNSKSDDTAAVKAAIEMVPINSTLHFTTNQTYNLSEISATTKGHINIQGNGASIVNTTQVAAPAGSALPILRVFVGSRSNNVTIENLKITGPRLTSGTVEGTGAYGGDPLNPGPGFPSGIDIPVGNKITIRNCEVSGTYYIGIECHYGTKVLIENCRVYNTAYAGIAVSDTNEQRICKNTVFDIGSIMVTNGYGITVQTSYNYPDYTYSNVYFRVSDNAVSLCKRKGIDVHNGIRGEINGNMIIGCAFAFIECICEGADKNVGDIHIHHNKCYGSSDINSGVTSNAAISVGGYGTDTHRQTNFFIDSNYVNGVTANSGIMTTTGDTSGRETLALVIVNNVITQSSFSGSGIAFNNSTVPVDYAIISNNMLDGAYAVGHIYIRGVTRCIAVGNSCNGTTAQSSAVVNVSGVSLTTAANVLNGVEDA